MNRRNFLQQLASKLLGHPVIPADVWEQKISGNFRLGEVLANILKEPSELLLREASKDPKAILIETLLSKLGPANHPLLPSTPYTPEFLVSNLLQVTIEDLSETLDAKRKSLSHTDYHIWDFETKPLLAQSNKDYESLKELLYRAVVTFVGKHSKAGYNDIAEHLWTEYQQEVSDYARSATSRNRQYFMQYIIRESLFDALCTAALLFVEEAGSDGCRYSDIIDKLSQLPEYEVIMDIWPPYKDDRRIFRAALKECLENAKFTKTGATSNLLWTAPTDVKRSIKSLSHADYRLWDFEAKPLPAQRSKDYESLKELLYEVVTTFISHHPNAKYDAIAEYIWAEYRQEVSDYARSFTSKNRLYFMQFIIREALFDTLCAMALLNVEEAGSKGCRYSDIAAKLAQFPEYEVILDIWPPYKNDRNALRSALKECLESAKFTKIGATANLLWIAPAVAPRTDKCDHADNCNNCKIRLRCRICSNSSPNSSGNTCMRCAPLARKVPEILSLSGPDSQEVGMPDSAIEDRMVVSKEDMHSVFAEAMKEEQAKAPMTAEDKEFWISTWGEVVAEMDICTYPTSECDYPSVERTQYRDFSEFLLGNEVTELIELPKNIKNSNPYYLREADREWYAYISEYYMKQKLAITHEILNNIASRFGVTSAYICNTLKAVLKIALLDCDEKPTIERNKYKLAICTSSPRAGRSGEAWIDDWYSDTFTIKVITDSSIAQLSIFEPDAALIWVATSSRDDVTMFKNKCESLGIPYFFRLKSKSDAVESARDAGIKWFVDAATSRKELQRFNPSKRNPDEGISVRLDAGYWIYTQKNKEILSLRALPISSAAGTAAFREFIAFNCGFLVPEIIPHQEHPFFIFKDLGDKTFVVCKYAVTDLQMIEHLLFRLRQDTAYTNPVYSVVQNIPSIMVTNYSDPFTTFIGRQTVKFVNLAEYLQMGILQQEESTKIITALPTFDQQTSPTGYLLVTHGHAARFDFEIQLAVNKKIANQQWRDICGAINDNTYLKRVIVPDPNSAQAVMLGESNVLRLYCVVSITAAYQIYFIKNVLKSISKCPVKAVQKSLKERSRIVRKKVAHSRAMLKERFKKLIQKRKRKKPKG